MAADGGDVAMPLREAFEYYGTARGAVANYTNAFAVESYERPTVDAQEASTRLVVPFLLVHSEHALAPSLARKFYATVTSAKCELWLDSVGQIDFYDDPRLIEPAAEAAAELFRRAGGLSRSRAMRQHRATAVRMTERGCTSTYAHRFRPPAADGGHPSARCKPARPT